LTRTPARIPPSSDFGAAREVRKYHIPDFSNWKNHDAFERAFAKSYGPASEHQKARLPRRGDRSDTRAARPHLEFAAKVKL
jgi:hypothetical protein